MRRLRYMTEDGALTVGSDDFQALLPNGYGDGAFDVLVFDSREEWDRTEGDRTNAAGLPLWEFVTSFACRNGCCAQGVGEIPDGRWGAFSHSGRMALVMWGPLA